jgi:NitT/TauT family transport system substrate-binding protein
MAFIAGQGLHPDLQAADPARVLVAVPGPGNLLFLPIPLAARLGLDRQENIALDIRYVGGGPQAYQDLHDRNVDFGAGGLSALALQRLAGRAISAIVPTTRVPAYSLLVRANLRGQVRRIADLAGRVVGVKGHTPGGRSTSQLFTEYVMAQAGVPVERLNYVSVGQSYDSQHAGLVSGAVDAIMGDEPFATRLVKEKVAFLLADYHDPAATRALLGGLFLNGALSARDDTLARQPERAARVVRSIQRALTWIDQHSAQEVVDALRVEDPVERANLSDVLALRKNIYSPDGRFSDSQLATVERFVHATETSPQARSLKLASVVNARWAGRAD